ncbi:MAG: hypothetical protein KTR30_05650 [Saprospiraceae bacterium]|nr:hypothetical protein [Saprospiraceae bacterium]
MGQYYQIINGQRYNASLINNASFRTRGAGDGRISLQDAQDLWQLAMDGGRITEIEEATIAYLLEAFNWTAAATEWIQGELAKQVEEIKSYYRVIDGLRYDRKVLDEADARTQGQGDGRISQDDAEFLLPLFGDFGDVTIIEERTLQYVLENYNWTEAAQNWFLERVTRISRQSQVSGLLIAILKYEFEFERLSLAYFEDEALQQMLDFENKVSLPDALRKVLDNLLNNTAEGAIRANLSYYNDAEYKEFLEGGRLVLLPGDIASEPSLSSFPTPLRGESLATNWILGLELFDLSDDIYWVIVPRDGQGEVYNYIGGANVEDEWPRPGGEAYFFIEVKSCDLPYPGITVDVQDPNGNYIVGKSNAAGVVKITGPAGLYSIYASDGWSSQSKSFEWDGQGTDQVRAVVLDC